MLHHSFETVAVLGFIVGLFWVVGGLAEIFAGFSHEAEGHRAGPIVLGLLSAIIGIVCLVYPGLSLQILSVLIGIGLIIYGAIEIVLAFQLRALAKGSTDRPGWSDGYRDPRSAGPAHQPARTGAGVLAVVEGHGARLDGGHVARGVLEEAPATGRAGRPPPRGRRAAGAS